MTLLIRSLLIVAAAAIPVAAAADSPSPPEDCDTYTARSLNYDLLRMDEALAVGDPIGATVTAETIEEYLPCLDTVIQPIAAARFARQRALIGFYKEDEAEVLRWAPVVAYTYPDLPWPEYLEASPFRAMIEGAKPQIAGSGETLVAPGGGAVFWNGRYITKATAPTEVPAFIQVARGGKVVDSWWQDGVTFPEAALTDAAPGRTPAWVRNHDQPEDEWVLAYRGFVWADTNYEESEAAHAAALLGFPGVVFGFGDADALWNTWVAEEIAAGRTSPRAYYVPTDGTVPQRLVNRARSRYAAGRDSGLGTLTLAPPTQDFFRGSR